MRARFRWICLASLLVLSFLLSASIAFAQVEQTGGVAKVSDSKTLVSNSAIITPLYKDYKGITIGMSAREARKSLERYLKAKDDNQDFLILSENESAQVFYDANGKIKAISVDYVGKNGDAPTPAEVLGKDVQPKPDGSIYALQRYPAAGYWVSYNRTAGDQPVVTVTMQVMQ